MDKPSEKMSQTFIDFVRPVLPEIDEYTTEHQIKSFFEIGLMVWNAVLLDSIEPDNHYMERINDLLAMEPGYELFIEPLIERRKTLFKNDKRIIEDFSLTYDNGNIKIQVDAEPVQKPEGNDS